MPESAVADDGGGSQGEGCPAKSLTGSRDRPLHPILDRGLHLAQPPSRPPPAPSSVDERITVALQHADRALSIKELRLRCRVRNATLYERLTALSNAGALLRTPEGYRLAGRN